MSLEGQGNWLQKQVNKHLTFQCTLYKHWTLTVFSWHKAEKVVFKHTRQTVTGKKPLLDRLFCRKCVRKCFSLLEGVITHCNSSNVSHCPRFSLVILDIQTNMVLNWSPHFALISLLLNTVRYRWHFFSFFFPLGTKLLCKSKSWFE